MVSNKGGNLSDPRVRILGQKMHRDPEHTFSFWRPLNWKPHETEGQYGIAYYPEEDPRTGFYVLVRDLSDGLDKDITEADLPDLYEGIVEGLKGLPECEVLAEAEINKESAIGFEFLLTFALDDERYKRRMRLLYEGQQHFIIYGQGTPPSEYDVFANIFDWMYLTLTFSDLLGKLDAMHPPIPSA